MALFIFLLTIISLVVLLFYIYRFYSFLNLPSHYFPAELKNFKTLYGRDKYSLKYINLNTGNIIQKEYYGYKDPRDFKFEQKLKYSNLYSWDQRKVSEYLK